MICDEGLLCIANYGDVLIPELGIWGLQLGIKVKKRYFYLNLTFKKPTISGLCLLKYTTHRPQSNSLSKLCMKAIFHYVHI